MKHHRGDPHGHSEEAKARRRGGHAHSKMLKAGGAHHLERKRGGGVPGEGKIRAAEDEDLDGRKKGGKVHGEKPKHRLDKRARGGRMTPMNPLSGAGGAKPPFPHPPMPMDEGGKGDVQHRKHGGHMKKRADGGAMGEKMPAGTQYKRGGRACRAAGGRAHKAELRGESEGMGRSGGGRLTAAERHHLPSSDFALPGKGKGPGGKGAGSYPIPNASHARNALARVAQHGSPSEQAAVRRKVHAKFPDIGKS